MTEPLSSVDKSKQLYSPSPPAAPPPSPKKSPAVNLDYVPAGAPPATFAPILKPASPASMDPSSWPDDLLERNYRALRIQVAQHPETITAADRKLLDAMEATIQQRQGTAGAPPTVPKPKSAVALLADSGVKLADGAAKAHMTTEEIKTYVAQYTAYVASRKDDPKYATLHADALTAGPKMIAAALERDRSKQLEHLRLRVGEAMKNGAIQALQVPVPLGIQQAAVVAPVAVPVAEVVDTTLAFVPIAGQFWSAWEIASGKTLGGLGMEIPTAERLLGAVTLALPIAGKLLAGSKGAETVLEIARRTGKKPDEVIALVQKTTELGSDAQVALDACQRIKVGKPLSAAHHIALDHAEKVFGVKIPRKYQPTTAPDVTMPAGHGETDKYGNITYSPFGGPEDVALAKAHESVHSLLSPKTLHWTRELRADLRMKAYVGSSTLRYLEEAAAEMYAQAKVKGLDPKAVITGARFPFKEGYVTFLPGTVVLNQQKVKTIGVGAELVIGTITYAGVIYTAKYVAEKTADVVHEEVTKAKAAKAGSP